MCYYLFQYCICGRCYNKNIKVTVITSLWYDLSIFNFFKSVSLSFCRSTVFQSIYLSSISKSVYRLSVNHYTVYQSFRLPSFSLYLTFSLSAFQSLSVFPVVSIDFFSFSFMPFPSSGVYFLHQKKPIPNAQNGILLL